jgi:hypothetical protein
VATGADASRSNVGSTSGKIGGSHYKGEDYYQPGDVPDSIAAQGNIPPESITQASNETEGY